MVKKFKTRREKEREQREADIITAAEKIFYQKGFENSSMDEIAKEAQFTKRTLYHYFPSKEELYFTIARTSFRHLIAYFETALAQGRTGIEKFRLSSLAYYQFHQDYPAALYILNHCYYIQTNREVSPNFQEIMNLKQTMIQQFAQAIELGKQDGTVRRDLDAVMGVYSAVFLASGFLNHLSQSGPDFTSRIGIDQDEFVRFSLELVCRALQA